MTEQYIGWALVVGLVIGGALVWFAIGRLPRSGAETSVEERTDEATWISRVIGERGGDAPEDLVREVLDLHSEFLDRETAEGV